MFLGGTGGGRSTSRHFPPAAKGWNAFAGHQEQRSSSGHQPQLWQPITQAGSEKWFCFSSTDQVSPCSVYPSNSPWYGLVPLAGQWKLQITSLSGSQGLSIIRCGSSVEGKLWLVGDEEHLGDGLGTLKYLREATREDGDTGEYLWFLLSFLASWLLWTAGKSVCMPRTEGCCGERGRVFHPTQRSREGLYEELPAFTSVHPIWSVIYHCKNPGMWQEKWLSSPHTQ